MATALAAVTGGHGRLKAPDNKYSGAATREQATQTQCDRLLHRPAAVGHHRRPRQPAGADAQLRPHGRSGTDVPTPSPPSPSAPPRAPACRPASTPPTPASSATASSWTPNWRRWPSVSAPAATPPATSASGTWAMPTRYPLNSVPATRNGSPPTCWSSPPTPTTRCSTIPVVTRAAAGLPCGCTDRRGDSLCRFTPGRILLPLRLLPGAALPEPPGRLSRAVGYREQYTGRWTPPDLAKLGGSSAQHLGGYYGMVKRLDEALGRLLDALRSLDLLRKHGRALYLRPRLPLQDPQRRVQALVPRKLDPRPRRPVRAGFDGGGQIDALVSLVDLPPTLLDAAGLPIPGGMQGRSILGLLQGDPEPWPEEVFVQISESQVAHAIRTRRWKYCVSARASAAGSRPARTTTSRRRSTTWRPTPTNWRTSPGSTPSAPSPTTCANASSPAWSPPAKPRPQSKTPPYAPAASVRPPSPRCAKGTTTRRRRGARSGGGCRRPPTLASRCPRRTLCPTSPSIAPPPPPPLSAQAFHCP